MIDQQPGIPFFPMDMKCSASASSAILLPSTLPLTTSTTSNLTTSAIAPLTAAHVLATKKLLNKCGGGTPITATLSSSSSSSSSSSGTSTNAGAILSTMAPTTLCGACCRPIHDRYIMKIVDISYHENCLQCNSCTIPLINSCFIRDGKIYCRIDYERLYVKNRCLGCGEKIGSDEFVMRAMDSVFHLKCFICVVCGVRLQKGDQYVIKQSQLFCRPDYEKEVEMFQGFTYDDYCCDDIFQSRVDGRRGPKRPRTILTTQQRRAFKASFDVSPKPCRKIREGLAKDTGLSIRIVQVWFQNQRAKVKKIQKKQQKENNKNSSKDTESQEELSENESKLSIKIKDENSRSNNYLHDSCSDTEGGIGDNDSFGSRMSGNDSIRHVKEEIDNDEEYFRLMSNSTSGRIGRNYDETSIVKTDGMTLNSLMGLDYSSLQQLATSLAPHQSHGSHLNNHNHNHNNHHHHHHHNHHNGQQIINPIDRLYSMQNSYFCSENSILNHSNNNHQLSD